MSGPVARRLAIRRSLVSRAAMRVPRFDPHQVAEKVARGEQLAFVDVRGPQSAVGERIPGAICLLSSGRSPEAVRSGEAASKSRHGAFEPGTGLRCALCWIAAFSF